LDASLTKLFSCDKAAGEHLVAHAIADCARRQVFFRAHPVGVKDGQIVDWLARWFRWLVLFSPISGLFIRLALGNALHDPIQCFWPIWWLGVFVARRLGRLEGFRLRQLEIGLPASNMLKGWPALPPAWQRSVRIEAQRYEQLSKKIIEIRFARPRVLLLLYWFP
jgi:hypothetical protein